ncbi:excinuclease ABC subunit UvrA [Cerasicoccus maritimus]|uniref:excinuclease ABC subunit UvrA n=1 Tax=Cerasicoccus maritimus TaxID=490089 RepID=UPI0028528C61|nr:excinuclease ABC subunit UvrA [Cerasicoccus maritimus]
MPFPDAQTIRLRGARQNNLQGVDLDLPLGKLICVTGLSGAGKSSLVFDTLHAEGQRRYVETFSPYTRQFLEMLDRPKVDSIENIRPSIAIRQSNTVKTSRSTVGTMTELCDYFKVWFGQVSQLIDPATGKPIHDDNPQSIWRTAHKEHANESALVMFEITRPGKLKWKQILDSISGQGFTRVLHDGAVVRVNEIDAAKVPDNAAIAVIVDKVKLASNQRARFIDAATTALKFGQGQLLLAVLEDDAPTTIERYTEGLHSPATGQTFSPATANLFSFNSPVGACPRCRGFGRVIEIDYRLVVPDETLTLAEGAIKPFQGEVYSESLRDLKKAAKQYGVPMDVPWRELSDEHRAFVLEGESGYGEGDREWPKAWYGVKRFFAWLEGNTYKMHVRVFLSRFRSYTECPDCHGSRLVPEALNWKWRGHTLPELYQMPIGELHALIQDAPALDDEYKPAKLALDNILTRLNYLTQVGLEYLTLDRTSRTLSGGEAQRVNLTSCLGASLVDTLFVLDEPSIGLHARDIDRLVRILRNLTEQGNTVVVVEHDESVMRAADWLVEIGPQPGSGGGRVVYAGPAKQIATARESITGQYLSGTETITPPTLRRKVTKKQPALAIKGACKHNLDKVNVRIPLSRFVALTGVSGSGKSTLIDNVIHQGVLTLRGKVSENPAAVKSITGEELFGDIVLVDQSPVSKTPRSNPALFADAWDGIRNLFASTEQARQDGLTASHFSFNSGQGRCEHCQGLGFERVEMQFLSDVYVPCPICESKRFKPEILAVRWKEKSVDQVLALTVHDARAFFKGQKKIESKLAALTDVGLGYLPLGQPLNTLSGGESQRLKLVKYLSGFDEKKELPALLLLDEPTTGLHRDDVKRLIAVLQKLVDHGHSLVVIEHQLDMILAADWLIEMGPGAGDKGGQVVFEGTPPQAAKKKTETAHYLREALDGSDKIIDFAVQSNALEAAESTPTTRSETSVIVSGAREHNLRNLDVKIPHGVFNVVTGVSGSGKSSLAFDIIFAEGQRRFLESMSSYARQFVEQLPRPDIDDLRGIPPTVAIEQRITRGTRKSTVATITEVAQYLRLLYAKVGIQHSPTTGEPVAAQSLASIKKRLATAVKSPEAKKAKSLYLCAPLIRSRKGHHQPLANWAEDHGYELLRCDGQLVEVAKFEKLDRYREHDIELALDLGKEKGDARREKAEAYLGEALKLGKGSCFLLTNGGEILAWFSTSRTDPATGEAFPELDPKHFSWNSPKGWCETCRGHGMIHDWMLDHEDYEEIPDDVEGGSECPDCHGERLSSIARAVRVPVKKSALKKFVDGDAENISLPALLALPPSALLAILDNLKLDARGKKIAAEIVPEVTERLKFMDRVGLSYLTLDRATATLSGGEAQRIRLAAQLGSNLAGVLYVLDEPSIGLHARDNDDLIKSLHQLRDNGNTLLVVEHDDETMRAADNIIDLGPGAGVNGGRLLAQGDYQTITKAEESLTGRLLRDGIPHPLRGSYRKLPKKWSPRSRAKEPSWLVLRDPNLRNLKGGELRLPLERLIMVSGVSGAGKSTMMRDLLHPAVDAAIAANKRKLTPKDLTKKSSLAATPDAFTELFDGNAFRKVIEVDQAPIGKTPRSTPATYIGAFDIIRDVFATLPEAKMRGLTPGAFSFNTKGGRCETCKGAGRIKLEMAFLPNSYQPCDECGGLRYGKELLDLRWNGKNIADVLDMTFEEAAEFFDFHSRLGDLMKLMVETGLGYLTLGQSSPTLSGGEAQRLKLVSELAAGLPSFKEKSRNILRRNLYILEEPTIGLHLSDCQRLIELLHRLVDQRHTVIVIEHNLDLIAEADYAVEIGPQGGEGGGKILYQGEVKGLAAQANSPTAPYLKTLVCG